MKNVALERYTEEILDAVAISKHRNLPLPNDALLFFFIYETLAVSCKTKERAQAKKM